MCYDFSETFTRESLSKERKKRLHATCSFRTFEIETLWAETTCAINFGNIKPTTIFSSETGHSSQAAQSVFIWVPSRKHLVWFFSLVMPDASNLLMKCLAEDALVFIFCFQCSSFLPFLILFGSFEACLFRRSIVKLSLSLTLFVQRMKKKLWESTD